jgi:para-nitrobenzyl esterase
MVYIHGGGGTVGSGLDQITNGTQLAQHGVVVVTLNYRLGPLGFLAHPALSRESPDNVSGNYALLDQVQALRWVRDNIREFGGDPGRVTIWGQSAGASFVGHLMTMPLARGLFHRAIAQSGTGLDMGLPLRGPRGAESGEALGERLVAAIGMTDSGDVMKRLRALPADAILRAAFTNQTVPDGPVVDGKVLPSAPHSVFEKGEALPVPLLVGRNSRELTTLRFLLADAPQTPAEWEQHLARDYGIEARLLDPVYHDEANRQPARAAERLLTDQIFSAPALLMAEGVRRGGQPAYLYLFSADPLESGHSRLGAFHGAELPFLFGRAWPGLPAFGERQAALSRTIMDLWISFATRGDPNSGDESVWPVLEASQPLQLVLDDSIAVGSVGDTAALRVLKSRVRP